MKLRDAALQGESVDTGWAEWSVEHRTDPHDREAWYQTNPSLGTILTERKILAEIGTDDVDFNIQRLGLWLRYNQKSAISRAEWDELRLDRLPALTGRLCVGIKYGRDGEGVAMAVAVRAKDGNILVEAIGHRPIRDGDGWLLDFLARADTAAVVVDGANGQRLLADAIKQRKLKAPVLPSVAQVVLANAAFQSALFSRSIRHMGQPSVVQIVSNCEKRAIGSNGGFGYRSIMEGAAVELLDAVILAHWACSEQKERRKQTVRC
jgi:phage terminase large subunit-like protein